jgi:hypothetical protein
VEEVPVPSPKSAANLPEPDLIRYRRLDSAEIVRTAGTLRQRILERFPDSGLGRVAGELIRAAQDAEQTTEALRRPNYGLRVGVGFLIVLLFAALAGLLFRLPVRFDMDGLSNLLQGLEAGVNDLVFIGFAIWFLTRLEARWKRRRALKSLHALRSLAHIIDMHQLTKDPERVTGRGLPATESSPVRQMPPEALARYLDYCSEQLAIISKVAALHVQEFDDAETLAAVREIEGLTSGLSRKIWQKIMILDRVG